MRESTEEDRKYDHQRKRLKHSPEHAEGCLPVAHRDIA